MIWGENCDLLENDLQTLAQWRKENVGFVFQNYRLVEVFTVHEHLRMMAAMRYGEHVYQSGLRTLEMLGLKDKLNLYPHQLSGGEKQRLATCMAISFQPKLLLADEPTAALDAANSGSVAIALRNYARSSGAIVIAVSHDKAMIDNADECVALIK